MRRLPRAGWLLAGVVLVLGLAVWAASGETAVEIGQGWTPGLSDDEAQQGDGEVAGDEELEVRTPPWLRAVLSVLFMLLLLVIGLLFLLGVITIVFGMHRVRRRRLRSEGLVSADAEDEESAGETMHGAARRALDRLRTREGGEPGDAVMEAWLALEGASAAAGSARRAHQTSTEFTASVLRELRVDEEALDRLRRLYQRARFSGHAVTDDDVAAATAALDRLVADLRAGRPAEVVAAQGEAP